MTKPSVTMYEANFVRLQPFGFLSPSVFPSGAATLNVNPAPTSEFGGSFYVDRTLVTMTSAIPWRATIFTTGSTCLG